MSLNKLNPYVRFSRAFFENPMSIPSDSICYDSRIFFFNNTSGQVKIGKEIYNIWDKTAIFLPPESVYKFDIDFTDKSSIIILNFDLTNEYSHITNPISPANPKTYSEDKILRCEEIKGLCEPIVKTLPGIERLLNQCADNFIMKNEFYIEKSSALVKLSLLEFIKKDSASTHSETLKKVLKYIRESFSNPALTNEEIAKELNYHPYYLSSLVKAETGKSLHQFIIYFRIQTAKDMLSTTGFDISEIAYRCGFETAAYFTKMFRKNSGCSPTEYREQHKIKL